MVGAISTKAPGIQPEKSPLLWIFMEPKSIDFGVARYRRCHVERVATESSFYNDRMTLSFDRLASHCGRSAFRKDLPNPAAVRAGGKDVQVGIELQLDHLGIRKTCSEHRPV